MPKGLARVPLCRQLTYVEMCSRCQTYVPCIVGPACQEGKGPVHHGYRAETSSQKLAGFSSESWSQDELPDRLSPCCLRLSFGQPHLHSETLAGSFLLFFKIASVCKGKWYLPHTVDKRVHHHRTGHSCLVHPGLVLRWLCSHITTAGSGAEGGHSSLG